MPLGKGIYAWPYTTTSRRSQGVRPFADSRYRPADSDDLLPKVDKILYYVNEV